MDYEEKYKEALERAKIEMSKDGMKNDVIARHLAETIFPELAESEDEKIKKALIKYFTTSDNNSYYAVCGINTKKMLDWLEKQGKCETDCHRNHQDANYPNGCITLEDFNGGEGFYKLNLDYLNKKQVKEIEEMVRTWNKESKTSNENIKNCIGICLTDANEQRFKDYNTSLKDCLDWLKRQSDYANFRDKAQVGDRITKNEAGVLVNLSQLKRVAKPADKVELKFKVGDWIINPETRNVLQIKNVLLCGNKGNYEFDNSSMPIESVDRYYKQWTIKDAKDGDVLKLGEVTAIFQKYIGDGNCKCYCSVYDGEFEIPSKDSSYGCHNAIPATKEQRGLLFRKMNEAGYEWDAEKKELNKIKEEVNGEDYGIDGLYHAQRILEKTIGKVDGYQSDDGILEHKCAITAVKKLYEHKPTNWSEEEIEKAAQEWELKANFNPFYMTMDGDKPTGVKQDITTHKESFKAGVNWILKSLRPQNHWKPSDEQMESLDWQLLNTTEGSWAYKATKELIEDLKKLKEV